MKKILFSAIALLLAATSAVAQCDAPADVQVNATWKKANISWRSPLLQNPMTLDYGITHDGSIGNGRGTYTMGTRFPADSLQRFAGKRLRSVSFFPYKRNNFTLKVYKGGSVAGDTAFTPGTLVCSQQISASSLMLKKWNEIPLATVVNVSGTEELWVAIEVDSAATGDSPLGFGYTNSIEGCTNIGILDNTGRWRTWHSSDGRTPGLLMRCNFIDQCSISGFNVFRNNVQLNSTPITDHAFIDTAVVPQQQYCYTVQSVCGTSASTSSQVCMTIPEQPACYPMVGNGTTGVSYLPFAVSAFYSYTQQIYTAAEIGAQSGSVASITFQYYYNTPYTWNDIVVYMANTNLTEFANANAWVPASALTQVYRGPVYCSNADSNNVTINLDEYFEWDGSSNIVVAIVNNQGIYAGFNNRFYTHATTGNTSLRAQSFGTSPYNIYGKLPAGTVGAVRNNMKFCFGAAASCFRPTDLHVSNVSATGATLTWHGINASDNGWEAVVVPSGNAVSSGTPVLCSDTTCTFANLQPNTEYDLYVRTACADESQSRWATVSFRTLCNAYDRVPYTENFSGYGIGGEETFPYCWTRHTNGMTNYPYVNADNVLQLYSTDTVYSLAVTQALDLSDYPANTLAAGFRIAKYSEASGRLDVGVMTDPNDLGTFTLLKSYYPSDLRTANAFQQEYITLSSAYTQPVYVAFYAPAAGVTVSNDVRIDNVTVDSLPTCTPPTNLTVASVTGTAAVLSWTASRYGTQSCTIGYGVAGQTMTYRTVTDNSCMLTGLAQGTQYNVCLFSNCSEVVADTLTAQFTTLNFVECAQPDTAAGTITGTVTESVVDIPVNNFYSYTYTQEIYSADEIDSTHTPTTITAIAFDYGSSTPMTAKNNVKVYLAHRATSTFASFFDWTPLSEATLVYEGPLNCTQGWNTFDLDTYFAYNGTDNIVVIIDDNSNAYNDASCTFNAHPNSTGIYRTMSRPSDGTDIDAENPGEGNYINSRNNIKFIRCSQVVQQSCPVPMVYVSAANESSVTVAWIPNGNETAWGLEYRAEGDTVWTNIGTVNDTVRVLDNLASGTSYEVRVRALCSATDNSQWVYATGRTVCASVGLPLTENFETSSIGTIPECWSRICNTQTAMPSVSVMQAHNGSSSLYFKCMANQYAYLVSPRLSEDVAMESLRVKFAAYKSNTYNYIEVGVMSDPADPETFMSAGQFSPSLLSTWEDGSVVTRNYAGTGRYVAFRIPQWFENSIYIDDISIDYIPSCMGVENISAISTLPTATTITWTPGGSETSWNYIIGLSGTVDTETDTPVNVSSNTVTFNNLSASVLYDIYVQAACSETDRSEWKHLSFRTDCGTITALPYTEDFDSYVGQTTTGTNVMPSCWTRINNSSSSDNYYPFIYSNSTAYSPANCFFFFTFSFMQYADVYAIMPQIDTMLLPLNTLQLSFMSKSNSSSLPFTVQVGVMSDPANEATFVPVDTLVCTTSQDYTGYDVTFGNYAGGGNYIAFKVAKPASMFTPNSGFIDNVALDYMPQCSPVRNLAVDNITGTSAYFAWEAGALGTINNYRLEYTEDDGSDNWTVADSIIADNWYLLGGLNQTAAYKVRVRANCEDTESAYETVTFTTTCLAGGNVEIGSGLSASSNLPGNSNNNYSYSQQIFLASEMGGANLLNSVSFEVSALNTPLRDMQIYLMHTSESNSQNWLSAASAQLVYSGQKTLQQGWNTFNFAAPFQYNGTDNLALVVLDVTGSYGPTNMFQTHSGHADCSRYVTNDNTAYSVSAVPVSGITVSERNNVRFGGNCDSTVTCVAPSLMVTAVTETDADFVWARGYQESQWEMDYAVAGDSVWTSVPAPTEYAVHVSGLSPNTSYTARMRSVCGNQDESAYTYVSFKTACGLVEVPYSEDFNSYAGGISAYTTAPAAYPDGAMPSCWTFLNMSTEAASYPQAFLTSGQTFVTSGNSLVLSSSSLMPIIAVLPSFDNDISMLQISFKYRNEGNTNADGTLEVGYVTNPNDASTFTALYTCPKVTTMTDVEQVFSTVPALGVGNSFIALRYSGGNSSGKALSIDDIVVELIPSCARPAGLAVTSVAPTSVDLAWTETGTATAWNIEYGPQGFAQGAGTVVAAATNPFSVTGLTAAERYDFYVQASCGAGETSNWRGPVSATAGSHNMPTTGTTTVTMCAGVIYDDGGAEANYSGGCNGYLVINPEIAGNRIKVTGIGSYATEGDWDFLNIYDGSDDSGELLFSTRGTYSGTIPECISTTGSVTLRFMSDGSSQYAGFALRVSCVDSTEPGPGPEPQDTCYAPENLVVNDITVNSATLSWTQQGEPDGWRLYLRKGTEEWTSTNIAAPAPYALTDLAPESNYEAYIVAVCDDTVSMPSNTVTFTTLPDGIEDYLLGQTKLYPNPTSSSVTIVNSNCTIEKVEVYDVYGQTVCRMIVNGSSVVVSAEDLSAGMYFARIFTDRGTVVKPFTKR